MSLLLLLLLLLLIFIWLHQVLVAILRIFDLCCSMWVLYLQHTELQHMGTSSPTRDQTLVPCIGSTEP